MVGAKLTKPWEGDEYEGKKLGINHKTLLQPLTDIFRVCGGRWLRRKGNIVKSKIQVTPTQVELELKLGCDNNISLDLFGCSFSYISWMGWFGFVEGKTLKSYNLISTIGRHI